MVASQSLVVAGWKPFFWPSDSRSKAALSLVGDSVNALAMAAFSSSGRSELYAYMVGRDVTGSLRQRQKRIFMATGEDDLAEIGVRIGDTHLVKLEARHIVAGS